MTETANTTTYWFAAKAEVHGVPYVALRGVNFKGEFDRAYPHLAVGQPFAHVPTAKIEATDDTHGIMIRKVLSENWPALAKATISGADQGEWGNVDADGVMHIVTRVGLDLGKFDNFDELPKIVFKPGEELPFKRQPVEWVKAKEINEWPFDDTTSLERRFAASSGNTFIINDRYPAIVETSRGASAGYITNFPLQGSVAERFVLSFPGIFSLMMPSTEPSLQDVLPEVRKTELPGNTHK